MSRGQRKCADGIFRRRSISTRHNRANHFEWMKRVGALVALDPYPRERPNVWPKCFYCGTSATTRDHVIPRSRGGRGADNLVPACICCNREKQDLTLEEYRSFLAMRLNKPVAGVLFFRERNPR